MGDTEAPAGRGHMGRLGLGLGLAGLSAVLAGACQPPYGWWCLVAVAWVPMLVAQHQVLPRRFSALAPGVGIGGYYAWYLYGTVDASFARWMLAIPIVVAVAVVLGNLGERASAEATGYRRMVVGFPLVWTAAEFLRGFAPGIGTQGYLAYALFREPRLIQPVSIFGIHVLNLLILMVNWAVALGVVAALRRRSRPGPPAIPARVVRRWGVGLAATAAGWVLASAAIYQRPVPTVAVAAIQPGTHAQDGVELARSVTQSRRAAASGARIIVWREKALAGDPRVKPAGAVLNGLARQTGAYLVVGYQVVTPRGQRNEAAVISPDGRFLGVYGKQHPAIMFADDQTSLTAGGMPIYRTPYGRLSTIICFDLDYTDTARQAARRGAQILAVPSWDPPGDATKHYALLVFRAIENRLSVIKAESAYDSAIIDPYRNIVADVVTPGGSSATLEASVAAGSGHTPLTVFGDLWGWLVVAAAAITVAGRLRHH
ncbi:MAG TPA: nitrilase-related carbon-nitrogen hydrolase [Acidimicrobiales bacterium]|nr:nitrilase-related carbon-nitrogen hydrolase [Acidimicrobiales bacterium]